MCVKYKTNLSFHFLCFYENNNNLFIVDYNLEGICFKRSILFLILAINQSTLSIQIFHPNLGDWNNI